MTTPPAPALQTALDAELTRVAELDRVIRAAQAEQFRRIEAARLLAASLDGVTESSGFAEREFATRSFVAELATTLTVHEATAGRLVADAGRLTGPFEATLDALSAGTICVGRVRTLLELAGTLPGDAVAAFEHAALRHPRAETPSAFRRRLRSLRERIHPEPLAARHQRGRTERRVCLDPGEDGMAWLSLYLEAERGVAIIARLDALADTEQRARVADPAADPGAAASDPAAAASDPAAAASAARTREQLRLDLAAGLLLGGQGAADSAPTGIVTPKIYVTVPVLTLLGHTDQPAELDGYGPIDADTARRLAAHAPSFRRILTHPETGAYLSYGRDTYRVPADLAGYLRIRDGGCRFPGCTRTAVRSDIDHTTDWQSGGNTRHDNLAHLCRKHHRLKHNTRWRMKQALGGEIRWTSPAGREHTTNPQHPFAPARPPDAPVATAAPSETGVRAYVAPEYPEEPPWAAGPGRTVA